jgi:hypothetical protein
MTRYLPASIEEGGPDFFPDLIPLLPERLLAPALIAARRVVDLQERAIALARLSVRLPDGAALLAEAIAAARASGWDAPASLIGVAPAAAVGDRAGIIREALRLGRSIHNQDAVLVAIPVAPAEMLPEVWQSTDQLRRDDLPDAFRALGLRAGDLDDGFRARILAEASALRPAARRLRSQVGILPLLDAPEQAAVLAQGLATALRARSLDFQLLADFAPAWSDEQQLAVLRDLARRGEDAIDAAGELAGSLHPAVLLEWASSRRPVVVGGQLDPWLAAIVHYLPATTQRQLVAVILETTPAGARRRALADIAPNLGPGVLHDSLVAARDAGQADDWAPAIPGFAGSLDRPGVQLALSLARATRRPADRVRALIALVPLVSAGVGRDLAADALGGLELLPKDEWGSGLESIAAPLRGPDRLHALELARHIPDPWDRTSAIATLAGPLGAPAVRRLLADPRNVTDPLPWAGLIRDRSAELGPADLEIALTLADALDDADDRTQTIASVVHLAAGDERVGLVHRVVDDLRGGAGISWADTLPTIAGYLEPAGLSAVELAHEIEEPEERRAALEGMRPLLGPAERRAADAEIATLPAIESAGGRGAATGGPLPDPIAAIAALPSGRRGELLEQLLTQFAGDLPSLDGDAARAADDVAPAASDEAPAADDEAPSADDAAPAVTGGDANRKRAMRPPHRAYGLLDCPAEAVAGQPFEVEVGLSAEQAAGVAGPRMSLPPLAGEPYEVVVRISARGFSFGPGARSRQVLEVSESTPYPSVRISLVPDPVAGSTERRIAADFYVGGGRVGDAIRALTVVTGDAERTRPSDERSSSGVGGLAPTGARIADLTVTIRHADAPDTFDWTMESPHAELLPADDPPPKAIPGDAKAYLADLMSAVEAKESARPKVHVFDTVRGAAKYVRDLIPAEVYHVIRAIATKTGRPPTILLESEEPYIPWELAHVDPPLIAGVPDPGGPPPPPLPPFLAAQACIGRWVKAVEPSDGPVQPLPAPTDKTVAAMSVVWGDYSKVEGYQNLPHARAEARKLAKAYGATRINPTGDTMSALLNNETSPTPDLIHFAVHGHWSRTGTDKDGIILTDGTVLIALEVHGATLSSAPFVFLNACQVGAGHAVLGHYSGIAAEFVYAGASCVVAPIWAIDDEVASSVAETFYREVAKGEPPCEVLRKSRLDFSGASASATTMGYQFFGHPDLVVAGLPTGS